MESILPYFYGLTVFSIVIFLFIVLIRTLLNVETVYTYHVETIIKNDADRHYLEDFKFALDEKAKEGWKYERSEDISSFGPGARLIALIFVKTRTKIKLFK